MFFYPKCENPTDVRTKQPVLPDMPTPSAADTPLGVPRYASANRPSVLRFGREKRLNGAVKMIAPCDITPNPSQPRRFFEPDAIASLADSIRQYGIIQPLTVRAAATSGKYELIAGERRLRAAVLLGMTAVPSVILEATETESAALAIIENLQREDLNMFEQAAAISSLIRIYNLTQDEIAARLSVSQSFVANKLRLLRYLPDEREQILAASLTERHARALLRLSGDDRLDALRHVIANHFNVAETEEYVDSILNPAPNAPAPDNPAPDDVAAVLSKPPVVTQRRKAVIRDVRLFYNSVNHALDIMRQAGIHAESSRRETEEGTEILIRIPKART